MARATYAEVIKLNGGVDFNATWDETAVGNVCSQMDAFIDARAAPSTFGTGTNEAFFANMLTYRWIVSSIKNAGAQENIMDKVWDDFMEEWFQRLLTSTTYKSIAVLKGQDTS